jgi:methyl-accepting chemotaxis protein
VSTQKTESDRLKEELHLTKKKELKEKQKELQKKQKEIHETIAKIKKRNLGRRVMLAVVILGIVSILGVFANTEALNYIHGFTEKYDTYLSIQDKNRSIDQYFLAAQSYANVVYYGQGSTQGDAAAANMKEACESLTEACEDLTAYTENLPEVVSDAQDEALIEQITAWTSQMEAFSSAAKTAAEDAAKGDYAAITSFINSAESYKGDMESCEESYDALIEERIALLNSKTLTRVTGTNVFDQLLIAVNLFLVAVVVVILYNQFVKPARKSHALTKEIIEGLHSGNGDLTARVPVKADDEVGALSTGINDIMEELQNIISLMSGHAATLKNISQSVADNIRQSEDEVTSVSSIMEQMSAASEETSASLNQVTEQVDKVADLILKVYEQSQRQMSASAQMIKKVETMREDIVKVRNQSDADTQIIVGELEKSIIAARHVEKINELVDDILNIAEQTNLLSLNASIEAARAGEAGRGFAVVAGEISKLANDSSEAATRIQSVSAEVIHAVNDLAQKSKEISETLSESNASGRANVMELTTAYGNDIGEMSRAMEQFALNSQQVQDSISSIKESIGAINTAVEENVQGITNVTASTVEIVESISSVNEQVETNKTISNELYEKVSQFRI